MSIKTNTSYINWNCITIKTHKNVTETHYNLKQNKKMFLITNKISVT